MERGDAYQRQCTIAVLPGGALRVEARGTKLNPGNGFRFEMGGGPTSFDLAGELEAFSACRGPFVGKMQVVEDRGRTTYDARFGEDCQIVIH